MTGRLAQGRPRPGSRLMPTKPIRLTECGGMKCASVDAGAPVVRGVKLLGEESRNRRRYLPESVSPNQYEGKPVNLNHPEGATKQRVVQERFGWIQDARKEGDEWRGDLHYNPEHPFAKQFAWFAANKADQIGLSHDAVGTGRTENGIFLVEKVVEVKSVDLVADPASTKGLFESMSEEYENTGSGDEGELKGLEDHVKDAVRAICDDQSLDLSAKMKKIRAALKLLEEPEAKEKTEESEDEDAEKEDGEKDTKNDDEDEMKKAEESLQALSAKYPGVKKLFERVDAAETKLAVREKNDLAHRLCQEAKLPSVAVTPTFLGQLLEAKDEKAMKALIEDRKAIASIQKPRSTGPAGGSNSGQISNSDFAKSIREGR